MPTSLARELSHMSLAAGIGNCSPSILQLDACNRANMAIVAPRQDPDGGLHAPSGNDEDLCSHVVNELRSKAAPAQPSSSMHMEVLLEPPHQSCVVSKEHRQY